MWDCISFGFMDVTEHVTYGPGRILFLWLLFNTHAIQSSLCVPSLAKCPDHLQEQIVLRFFIFSRLFSRADFHVSLSLGMNFRFRLLILWIYTRLK